MQETIEYIKQAFELKSQQCYKQAIEMLYKALELESDNIEILFQLGELYFLLNNFARSQQYLEKVLLQNENHVETLEILEKIYIYSNELSKAFSTAERIFLSETRYVMRMTGKRIVAGISFPTQRRQRTKLTVLTIHIFFEPALFVSSA